MSEKLINKYSSDEQLQAAYALNMCTVSISQIIDYNDVYILEQEYEDILNNLNLEVMPKDEALLNILTELLNTISFFRIQEIKKDQIEKKYQDDMRAAIWHAVPNLSVIVSGNPVSMAFSLVNQIGIGYMNYRNSKAFANSAKSTNEMEIQISAMEQFHALRRELFTTAWKLADEYKFPDKYRLTERQIKQYNDILMDCDDIRKYERLCYIADKFEAYPPFWYYLGHTATSIAFNEEVDINQKITYIGYAKKYFEKYYDMCSYSLLREDHMIASFALEYSDLLIAENENIIPEIKAKIQGLVSLAIEMSGNSNDILELCAITYMKIGSTKDAENILKHLVNEGYNSITNAKFLSRFYVCDFVNAKNTKEEIQILSDYKILSNRVNAVYLYPMPNSDDKRIKKSENCNILLEETYIKNLAEILYEQYTSVINEIHDKYEERFNTILPDNNVWNASESKCLESLRTGHFRNEGLSVLNDLIVSLDRIDLFRNHPARDDCINIITRKIIASNDTLKMFLHKMNTDSFEKSDMNAMRRFFSFEYYTDDFFDKTEVCIINALYSKSNIQDLDNADLNLTQVCMQENINIPLTSLANIPEIKNDLVTTIKDELTFPGSLLEIDTAMEEKIDAIKKNMHKMIINRKGNIIKDPRKVRMIMEGEELFDTYFANINLSHPEIKGNTIAVIDDITKNNSDFVLGFYGVSVINGNKVYKFIDYDKIEVGNHKGESQIKLTWRVPSYSNKFVNIDELYQLIMELKRCAQEFPEANK